MSRPSAAFRRYCRPRCAPSRQVGSSHSTLRLSLGAALPQVLVQLRTGERVLWAASPLMRSRHVLFLLVVWVIILVVPAVALVELIADTGGWWAIAWAFVSIFIFVPRVSRASRVVFVLTDRRAFTSVRSMYCSIDTRTLDFRDVARLHVQPHGDGTGDITLWKTNDAYDANKVIFDSVLDLRGACRVLMDTLPRMVVRAAALEPEADADASPAAGGTMGSRDS